MTDQYDDVPLEGLPPEFQALLLEASRLRGLRPPERAEAREWFATNTLAHPLALNHFASRAHAEQFVAHLYEAGAKCVSVDNIRYREHECPGGSSSDALIVELPADPDARARILALCNQHCMADASTGARFVDQGQESLYLWWD